MRTLARRLGRYLIGGLPRYPAGALELAPLGEIEPGALNICLGKLEDALSALKEVAPWRSATVERHVDLVLLDATPSAALSLGAGAGVAVFRQADLASWPAWRTATSLLGQATAMRVSDRGLLKEPPYLRVAEIARRAEVDFLRRLPAQTTISEFIELRRFDPSKVPPRPSIAGLLVQFLQCARAGRE